MVADIGFTKKQKTTIIQSLNATKDNLVARIDAIDAELERVSKAKTRTWLREGKRNV